MSEIKITIDGKEIVTSTGKTVLDAALENGIEIPTFCWHPKLKSVGACRICLVEIEKMSKLQVSCATDVADGMIIHTRNERVTKARQGVIEFILLNHPLDCPTCDKGGECPLQDTTYHYGTDTARTVEPRQRFIVDHSSTFDDLPIGPEIIRNQNRCIHCYRCTRITEEVCEEDDLGAFNRGHGTEILPPPGRAIRNLYSGNVVEYCPVGALTNRDWRYQVRVWLTQQRKSVCTFCPDGCNTALWTARNRVFRTTARRNDRVDEGFLCDIGRYGYQFIHHADRLKRPLIKRSGEFVECTWSEAYDAIGRKIHSAKEKLGPEGIAALVSEDLSNEDYYVLGRLMRSVIGSNSLDHRLHRKKKLSHIDELEKLGVCGTNLSFDDLDKADLFVVIGSDLHTENPITALRLLKAKRYNNARIIIISPAPSRLSRSGKQYVHKYNSEIDIFTCLSRLILENSLQNKSDVRLNSEQIRKFLDATSAYDIASVGGSCGISRDDLVEMASVIASAGKKLFITGSHVNHHFQRDRILIALYNLALSSGAFAGNFNSILIQRSGANNKGCFLFGMRPGQLPFNLTYAERDKLLQYWPNGVLERAGVDTVDILRQIQESKVELAFIIGADPVSMYPDREYISSAVAKLDLAVVCDLYMTETAKLADIVLPISSTAEYSGTLANWEGRIQKFEQAITPAASSRPPWRIFSEIAATIGSEFGYRSGADVFNEFAPMVSSEPGFNYTTLPTEGLRIPSREKLVISNDLQRVTKKDPEINAERPYVLLTGNADHHIDHGRTTHSESLMRFTPSPYVGLSKANAESLALSEGDLVRVENDFGKIIGHVKYVPGMRDDTVFIPDNFPESRANVLMNRDIDIDRVSLVKV